MLGKNFAQIFDATMDVRINYTFPDQQMTPPIRHFLEAAPGLRLHGEKPKKPQSAPGSKMLLWSPCRKMVLLSDYRSLVIAADGHGGALVTQAQAGGDRCSAIRQTAEKMKKFPSCLSAGAAYRRIRTY